MWLSKKQLLLHAVVVLRKVTFRGLTNSFLLTFSFFWSRILKRPVVAGLPWALSVEPSGICNLQCPECPVGAGILTRKGGMMRPDLFGKIVNEAGKELRVINLFFQGEPMLNNKIGDLIQIAHKKRIYTNMSTNGHNLTEERCQELVNAGLTRLIISLDGITRESFSIYRKGGSLEKVRDGITNILRVRKSLRSVTPFVVVQFLVFRHNEHEIPKLKSWCREVGVDRLELKTAQFNDFGNDVVKPPLKNKYSRYKPVNDNQLVLKGKAYNHCYKQWSSAVVSWDGRVAPCCYDKDLDFSPGNVTDVPMKEVWNSSAMQKFRKQILTHRKAFEMCRNCPEGRNPVI
jgi:radical SAM protein with 4Fe4S-binding SPASM domain